MSNPTWTIGQLAKRTGVSVRALRHYDEIGLLSPRERTESGYRLYKEEDIARLHRVKALRGMGFSLTETRDLLNRSTISPRDMVDDHVRRLRKHIALEQTLCDRLDALARRLVRTEHISTEDFLDVIEGMSMVENSEKYYTPEQLAWLRERAQTVGADRIQQVESEWPELIAQVRAEMAAGTDPRDERVQRLASRWQGLVEEFTGGNPGIEVSLRTMYANEPRPDSQTGVDADVMAYIGKVITASH